MKTGKKILSLVLAVIMCVCACVPAFAAKDESTEIKNLSQYNQMLWDEGYPAMSMEKIVGIMKGINKIIGFFTGQKRSDDSFVVTVDSLCGEVTNYIYEQSGFDFEQVLNNMPDMNAPINMLVQTFDIDTAYLKKHFYEKRDQYRAEGNTLLDWMCHFLGMYVSIIDVCELYADVTSDPDVVAIKLRVVTKDGQEERLRSGILLNTKTGECYSESGNGLLSLGFDYSIAELALYGVVDSWLRNFGFCVFYDIVANSMPTIFRYVTRRIKFEYGGKDWMVQLWKGNYMFTNGGEVGFYNREPGKIGTYYDCAGLDEMLNVSMQLTHGDKILVDKPTQRHWWITGFNMSGTMYLPKSLTLSFTIEMPDEEMLKAFCAAVDKHYMRDMSYTVDGLNVSVVW